MENLRRKTFFSIIWCYIGKFGSQIIAILPAMILARLLDPSQYGLIAMAGIFTGIAYQLADAGFGNALVQKKDADNLDYCTVFLFNVGICGLIYFIIFICAGLIADFFNEVRLTNIIRVSSLGVIIISFGSVQSIIFKKELNYKPQVIRNLICQLLSVAIAIIMAFKGFGVWALVVQGLVGTTGSVLINWFISTWRPQLIFSFDRLKRLFRFGSKTLTSGLIDYGFNKAYETIIGKFYTPASLGLYNRAYSTADIFKGTFFGVFSGVTFPVFVQMQDDNLRLVQNIRKFLQIVSLVLFSVMGTVMALAHPIFEFMYSSKWDAAINLFIVACCSAMITPIISILESIILAKGHSGKFLIVSIIRKIFVVIVLALVWRSGVIWLMIGQVIVSVCECLIYTTVVNKMVSYNIKQLIIDILPSTAIASIVTVFVLCSKYFLTNVIGLDNPDEMLFNLTKILFGFVIALFAFIIICKLSKNKAYIELIQFIEDSIGNKKILSYLKIHEKTDIN